MNIKLRIVCMVMALLMLMPLTACGGDETEAENTTATTTQPPVEEIVDPNVLSIIKDGASNYKIVRSAQITEGHNISEAVYDLVDVIKERTGVELQMVTDEEAASEYEILIGETNRQESVEAVASLEGTTHFLVKAVGTKIVIAGGGTKSTVNAISCFVLNTVLNVGENKILNVNKDYSVLYNGTSGKSEVTLLGTTITKDTQIRVTIPEKYTASEKRLANYIIEYLFDCTGNYGRLGYDNKTYDDALEILVGNTSRTTIEKPEGHNYIIASKDGKLQFRAASMFAQTELLDYTAESLFNDEFNKIEITENFRYTADVSDTITGGSLYTEKREGDYRVMIQNIWGNGGASTAHAARHMMTLELCLAYDPDVLGFQEFNPKNRAGGWNAFDELLVANGYTEVTSSDSNYTPIFYRADRLTLIEAGYVKYDTDYGTQFNDSGSKSLTWAVFEDIKTKERFGVISTHFWWKHESPDDDNARLRNAQEVINTTKMIQDKYNGIAVITGGDLNCSSSSSPVKKILDSGYKSAAFTAQKRENLTTHHAYPTYLSDVATFGSPVMPTAGSEKSIDHILVKGDSIELKLYEVSTDLYSLLTSDHCAIFIDFNIK